MTKMYSTRGVSNRLFSKLIKYYGENAYFMDIIKPDKNIKFDQIATDINRMNLKQPSFFLNSENPDKIDIIKKIYRSQFNDKDQIMKSLDVEQVLEKLSGLNTIDSSEQLIKRWQ